MRISAILFLQVFEKDYRIITAADGEKGLKLTLAKLPDLIISDVMMPVMDGFEFCRQLKHDIRTSHIPVILLTAKTGDETSIRASKLVLRIIFRNLSTPKCLC